jgi:hypothetical protein
MKTQLGRVGASLLTVSLIMWLVSVFSVREAWSSCSSPANQIEAENCLPGTPSSTWDLPNSDEGDSTIQGFATDISVNVGGTVRFKINSNTSNYKLDIYRMGYYGGMGARKITTVFPFSSPSQPPCTYQAPTGLTDCGNWAETALWNVPANATSGVYIAKVIRNDTGGASHIIFIVRNDASHSDILFKTADATWQAYNAYSQDFYGCNRIFNRNCRAYKISYNRPFHTRAVEAETWFFGAEYPMIRWLEANGYDVAYFTDVDTDRRGSLILNHNLFLSNGHDEYWSGNQRTNVETARNAGVHLAFFSGNTVYWKTRWENSIDGAGVPYRTLVCYKETWAGTAIDPENPPTWTGTWRDPRFSPPGDGGRPENALIGTWTRIAGDYDGFPIIVPQSDGRMRFWRNTNISTLSPGQTATLAPGSLGAELDADEDNGFRPAGLFHLTTTTAQSDSSLLLDFGSLVGPGSMVHHLTLYRHVSGALVFSAGTYRWSWGLDANHDLDFLGNTTDIRMQQATVNLFADMGVQPATRQPGLVAATASTDSTAPTSSISAPSAGSSVTNGANVTITGTAVDSGGGVVGGVEISTDGGTTWHPATGRGNWSYTWQPKTLGATVIKSRAVDDSGNLESPSAGRGVTVVPCSTCVGFWSDTTVPTVTDVGADSPVEVGVQFRAAINGTITGIQFYKASTNVGPHVANLWSNTGALLATGTFTGESTSGWQQVLFSAPVSITANTVYTVSYHTIYGHYSADSNYFANNNVSNSQLQVIGGVYAYGTSSTTPTQTSNTNYWVDPIFSGFAPTSIAVTPTNPSIATGSTQAFTATGTYSNGSTQNLTSQVVWTSSSTSVATINNTGLATAGNPGNTTISATLGTVVGSTTLTVQVTPLTIATSSLPGGNVNMVYTATLAASGELTPYTWSIASGALPLGLSLASSTGVISGTPTATGTFSVTVRVTAANGQSVTKLLSLGISTLVTLWPSTTVPGMVDAGPDSPVELGVKFRSDVSGSIAGIRFYKASTNTGTHVAHLWTSSGTLLASATFTAETASGWQQVLFSSPVPIAANTVYVASYNTLTGHYSFNSNYFGTNGLDNPPLHALANGVSGGNGVYAYGAGSVFPTQSYNAANYWVDVAFSPDPPPALWSIAVTPGTLTISTGATQSFTATGTYSNGSTQNLTSQVAWTSSSTSVATINSTGLATAVNAGSTTISATLGSVTNSTMLTVQQTPLTITTPSLPDGDPNEAYTATLTASGALTPYTWSIDSGALPTGLSLAGGTGIISGTPTATGTFNFTARVTAGNGQTVTKPLTIGISTRVTLWSSLTVPGVVDAGPDSPVELGVKFRSDVNGTITGIRFYKASTNTGTHVAHLWSSAGVLLATATFTGETASGWQQVLFSSPVPIAANTIYVASYNTPTGHYSFNSTYFESAGLDSPPLHALADGVSGGNGVYAYGATSAFPSASYRSNNYWVDVMFQP